MKKLLIIVLFFTVTLPLIAQNSISQDYLIAYQYYRNQEYDKAGEIYKKLYDKTGIRTYFKFYIDCLYKMGNYQQAIKECKKATKKNKNSPYYKILLGQSYKMAGDTTKANAIFEKIVNSVKPNKHTIISIANHFISIREYKYAETLYLIGKKKLKANYSFNMELGNLYFLQRKYKKMVNTYLDMLEKSSDYYENILSRLQYILTSSTDDEIYSVLKKELIKRIQKKSNNTQYTNLMIWLLLKQNKHSEALNYAIILDKRKDSPRKILDIGKILLNDEKYDIAIRAFTYIMKKYKKSSLDYILAKNLYLQTLFSKLSHKRKTTLNELYDLKKEFEATFKAYSYNNFTFESIKNYTELIGRYFHKPDSAIIFLENIINGFSNNFEQKNLLELKLLLGDMYLISGDPWTATILYSRIERQNISSELRDKAKFKKAVMAFYNGDIEWSKALLDVLKGSTSKLIANDAFKLSEFITNNTTFDTNITPLKIFGRALFLEFAGKDSIAILTIDSLINLYPEHPIIDDAYLKKGELYEKIGLYDKAIEAYKYVADYYSFDILADNALYKLAHIYDKILNNPTEAAKLYKKIIIDYPDSIYAEEAREKYYSLTNPQKN